MTPEGSVAVGLSTVAAVVVRFNKPLLELPSVVMRSAGARLGPLIVVDNSTTSAPEDEVAALPDGVVYRWLGGNVGLSKAYNAAVRMIPDPWTHVMFLDQDTDGLRDLYEAIEHDLTADVTVPVVRSGEVTISPCQRVGLWYRPIPRLGHLPDEVSWINSGMIVARELILRVPFDERLFLDYVDHRFAENVLRAGASLRVLWDVSLEQDYSRRTDDFRQAARRFAVFRRDVTTFYGGTGRGRVWARALTLRRALVATAPYRNMQFLSMWTRPRRTTHGSAE